MLCVLINTDDETKLHTLTKYHGCYKQINKPRYHQVSAPLSSATQSYMFIGVRAQGTHKSAPLHFPENSTKVRVYRQVSPMDWCVIILCIRSSASFARSLSFSPRLVAVTTTSSQCRRRIVSLISRFSAREFVNWTFTSNFWRSNEQAPFNIFEMLKGVCLPVEREARPAFCLLDCDTSNQLADH